MTAVFVWRGICPLFPQPDCPMNLLSFHICWLLSLLCNYCCCYNFTRCEQLILTNNKLQYHMCHGMKDNFMQDCAVEKSVMLHTLTDTKVYWLLFSPVPQCTMTPQSVSASHRPREQQIAAVCSSDGKGECPTSNSHVLVQDLSWKTGITSLAKEDLQTTASVSLNVLPGYILAV